jgi:hypothetical protein
MLDTTMPSRMQADLALATTRMLRAYAAAASRSLGASARFGLMWSDLVRSAAAAPFDVSASNPLLASWQRLLYANAWRPDYWPAWNAAMGARAEPDAADAPKAALSQPEQAFSSYRSAGGHAAAQIIAPALHGAAPLTRAQA